MHNNFQHDQIMLNILVPQDDYALEVLDDNCAL